MDASAPAKRPVKRPSLGDLTAHAPPAASLARETVLELQRLKGSDEPADSSTTTTATTPAPREIVEAGASGRPTPAAKWTDADLRRALLEDAEVESVWVKFATQVRIETRERLNAFVLHGKRKRFNSTRIQDVVDAALSRYLDDQGFGRDESPRQAA